MSAHIISEIFSALCPWLLLTWLLQRLATACGLRVHGWRLLWLAGVSALGILVVPIDGVRIARWIAAINANFSIPLAGLLVAAIWEGAFARPLFAPREWTSAWWTGAIGGLLLYPMALGISAVDPYEWGWQFSPLFIASSALTAWLIWKQNRFGIVLLLAIIAFHGSLLESDNYWDYLVDPIYCLTSFVALAGRVALSTRTSLTKRFS
jgi:hypothetical protein